MRFAYADPPYLGCAKLYSDHPDHAKWDTVEAHADLIAQLEREYPDGWLLSCTTGNLWDILPVCPRPPRCRVGAWVKPFASFKPGVNPAYTWEPVIFAGGRKRPRTELTVRDHHAANIALRRGLVGAKPESVAFWLFDLLGMLPDDELIDLFPGTGSIMRAWEMWRQGVGRM